MAESPFKIKGLFRRSPIRSLGDVGVALDEFSDKLTEIIQKFNNYIARSFGFADLDSHPDTLEGYGIEDAAHLHHTHPISDVDGLQEELDALAAGEVPGSVAWDSITGKPSTFPPATHNHDSRYYKKDQVDLLLDDKADLIHNHDDRYYRKDQSDTLLGAKVNRLGDDYFQGFPIIPQLLTYDLTVPSGYGLVAVEDLSVADGVTLDVAGEVVII